VSTRILIAEDEPNLVESLSFILEREGCDVSAVFDGEAVLERVRADPPDVLILDVMLPKRNGFDVLHQIKTDPGLRRVRVMVLTAKCQESDRKAAENLGADVFISKPFSNQEVVEHVAQLTAP
jgi:DNA-binding response OmpR family regulator